MKIKDYLVRVGFALFSVLALTHCGSSGSSGTTSAVSTNYVSGNYCYNSSGVVVGLASTCAVSTTSTTGYYVNGSYCYNSAGTVVGLAATCSTLGTTTTGYSTGYTAGSCVGSYVYTGNGQPQLIQCSGTNCRGAVLYTYPGYQQVYCQ